ncbi:MAG: zinc-binding dehydrogenase [Bernardetiaceae bacterium]|nr:zinc-binding dehydrogenase [Bernardetiaceae bacterium]
MKALQLIPSKEGNRIEIRDIDKPSVGTGQVLVRLHAAALNRRDAWIRQGMYPGIQQSVLGSDGCGTVAEVGSQVAQELLGKSVLINPNNNWGDNPSHQSEDYHILGMPSDGTFAEYILTTPDRLITKPDFISFAEAAALPLAGLTAYRAVFTHGQVSKGKKVLISGAGGGVAQFAFQFAVAAGAEVYVLSGKQEKIDKLMAMGAKGGFNYKDENWAKQIQKSVGSLDVAIDSAGGATFSNLIRLLGRSGVLVFYGATLGLPPKVDLFRMFFNQIRIQGSTMGNDEEFTQMIQFVAEHQIKPVIDSVRPFTDIASAFDTMDAGEGFGKLVIAFDV